MIYSSLETIPYKLFIMIAQTSQLFLLDTSKKSADELTEDELFHLSEIWDKMHDEHLYKNETSESKKIFKLSKTIDGLLASNKVILMACASLKFEYKQDLVDIIRSYNYKLSTEDSEKYHRDLENIEREANAYVVKAEHYKSMIPEQTISNEKYSTDDIMACYSAILGLSIGDFNSITYSTFKGYEKQVNAKINAIKKNKDGK